MSSSTASSAGEHGVFYTEETIGEPTESAQEQTTEYSYSRQTFTARTPVSKRVETRVYRTDGTKGDDGLNWQAATAVVNY